MLFIAKIFSNLLVLNCKNDTTKHVYNEVNLLVPGTSLLALLAYSDTDYPDADSD